MAQQDPQQPLTPPDAPRQPNPEIVSAGGTTAERVDQQTDVLGIISIIMAFVGFQLIGIILAVIGMNKAKQENRPVTLSKVGLILNIVMMLIFLPLILFFLFIAFAAA